MSIPVPGRLAENVRQAVVQVQGSGGSSGSGVIVGTSQVLTNAHVLRGPSIRIESWDGQAFHAGVAKLNRTRDLALLDVNGLHAHPLPFADSRLLRPGTPVFAIGHPLGFVGAVSSGVIHSVHLRRWVCADVRLAPGNSGGPLTNFSGQIVGINTMVVNNLALAIPSHEVEKFLKHDDSRNLGVLMRGVKFKNRLALLVTEVLRGSAAEAASLMAGDLLTGANGRLFTHPDDLTDAIDSSTTGLLHIEFYRGDHTIARQVTARLDRQGVSAAA